MVKGAFFHYLPIYKDKNGVYCSTTLTNDLFSRYFCVVDKLYIATRVYQINQTYKEAHQEKISLNNIKIIEFPNLSNPYTVFHVYPSAKRKILKLVQKVDLIFIRGGFIADIAAEAAIRLKKPYLMELAGCAWDGYWNYNFLGKLIAPFMELKAKHFAKEASHIIYVTEKWLQKRYPTNGVSTYASNVILTEIDNEVLEKRLKKIAEQKNKDEIVFGTIGGISNKAKGQQFVIDAISKLKNEFNIKYELVGGGDSSYLINIAKKKHVKDKVVFKGQLTHEEVLLWLDSIDVYIQPSLQEGLPRSLIEAMSRACPAIGSTTAGIPELLNKNAIFKRKSVRVLTEKIRYFLTLDFKQSAIINFEKAKEYQIDLLNDRRTELYKSYQKFVIEKGEDK